MEKVHEYMCPCGREFRNVYSLGAHSRWCTATEEPNPPTDPSENTEQDEYAKKTEDDEPLSWLVSFRCVKCYAVFTTMEAYQDHFRVDHLGVSTKQTDAQQCDEKEPNVSTEKEEAESNKSRSFCKRCRSRIVSSSEEDDDMDQPPKKNTKTETCTNDSQATSQSASTGGGVTSNTIPSVIEKEELTSVSISAISKHQSDGSTGNGDTATRTSNGAVTDDSGAEQISQSTTVVSTDNEKYFEIVKDLLKGANAVSKPLKVLILNFVSGQRVNPHPGKGPVQTIRLGEKMETIVDEDGSKKDVLRESYVKLNYDTGKWEKIENTKHLHSTSSTDDAPI